MIAVENLVKKFGSGESAFAVLDGIDLSVSEGEFLIVTGRSGSGKSTLLYQMGLMDYPSAGSVIIDGVHAEELSAEERQRIRLNKLGYVFQDYALLPELSAVQNVALPLIMGGILKSAALKRAKDVLGMVGLLERVDHFPSELSGGQQQRVSVARAIVHRPAIIFADEPTANLDSTTAREVLGIFARLNREGQTIVMVTHEKEAAALAGRLVVLSDGRIAASGSPSQILASQSAM